MPTNHKGEWCPYNVNIFCQEGYCSECNIAKDNEIGYNGGNMIKGICKAKDLIKEITKAWVFYEHGIGEVWTLDTTDKEIIGVN